MKKVLIITYYWPPSGGAGVQRWLKFVKYLPHFGWQPIVYTVENGEYPVLDLSLEKEIPENVTVIKKKIWEPYSVYKWLAGKNQEERITPNTALASKKKSRSIQLASWIRSNFFIPDPRKFWIKPSIKFLADYLEKNPVDAIVTSSPPHSLQLIGLGLSRKTGIPWIADFRDPWSTYYFLLELKPSESVMKKHKKLEAKVLAEALKVIVVSPSMKENMEQLAPGKISIITNGYDEEDFHTPHPQVSSKKFSIVYTGTFLPTQNPEILWRVLSELIRKRSDFKNDLELKFVGTIDSLVLSDIEKYGLKPFLLLQRYVPHSEIASIQQSASVLLLSINNTSTAREILTGKLFEYLGAERPILCFGPKDGDAAKIILEAGAGVINDYENSSDLLKILNQWYDLFKNNSLKIENSGIEKFSRKELTRNLSKVLDEVVKKNKVLGL